jgi:hypothetical protein
MTDAKNSPRVPMPGHWVDHFVSNVDRELHSTMDAYEKQRARQEHANRQEDINVAR